MLVPPAPASMPTLVTAALRASISASLMPALVPAAAMLCAMSVIFFSLVAKLLPRSTMALPKLLYRLASMPVTVANCASIVAASSLVMLVAVPSLAMTSVKPARFSLAIPSCPPTSAMPASSVVVMGMVLLMSRMLWPIASNSAALISLVLATPAMALSNSMLLSVQAFSASLIFPRASITPAAASAEANASMASLVFWPISSLFSPVSFTALPMPSMLVAHPSALFLASSRYLPVCSSSCSSLLTLASALLAATECRFNASSAFP